MVDAYDPGPTTSELASKLSARTRHVCVFLGAGVSRAAGLPDLSGLQHAVKTSAELNDAQKAQVSALLASQNLEEVLSYLRRLVLILGPGESLKGFDSMSAQALQTAIARAIIRALDHAKADLTAFRDFASWVAGAVYQLPIEVFTINYDLLVESGFELISVPYFDGFVGTLRGQFHPELVDTAELAEESLVLPANFVRLWKLHGSVNWEETSDGTRRLIVRRGSPIDTSAIAAIYPSDEKYDQSRRVPFVVLMDRFRRALSAPETITLLAGYSFGDQHVNEMLFDAARSHPRSETVVFCHSAIPAVLADFSASTRNVCVLAKTEAIIGGRRLNWSRPEEIPGIWSAGAFKLGDFRELSRFLATRARVGGGGA
jgi:hypothetical protein